MTGVEISIEMATRQGAEGPNQDRGIVLGDAVAVLDGASSWLPIDDGRDGGWYASKLAGLLSSALVDRGGGHLARVLAQAIGDIAAKYGLVIGRAPSTTVSIVTWSAEDLEVLVLGDSPVILRDKNNELTIVNDTRINSTAVQERRKFENHLRAGEGFNAVFVELLRSLQKEQRKYRNTSNGFWVAEALPEAAHEAVTRSFIRRDIQSVILMTDGASSGVLEYAPLFTWRSAVDLIEEYGPSAYLRCLVDAEEEDKNAARWPRAKKSDDKTVILVRFLTGIATPGHVSQ
jgi:serine/threonine protein phosphatase PrpC